METKLSKDNYCLPRPSNATKLYAFVKILTILLYCAYTVHIILWTIYCVKYFREKIDEERDEKLRLNDKYRTHAHFFLFTGIFVTAITLIGLLGTAKENVSIFIGLSVLFSLGFVFELIGAIKSQDEEVLKLKLTSLVWEPFLTLFTLLFALMINNTEKKLSSQPIYRQRMAESRRGSFITENNKNTGSFDTGGHDNQALEISDENSSISKNVSDTLKQSRNTLEIPTV